jgi:O-antigen/teichoic acid export membrane protein
MRSNQGSDRIGSHKGFHTIKLASFISIIVLISSFIIPQLLSCLNFNSTIDKGGHFYLNIDNAPLSSAPLYNVGFLSNLPISDSDYLLQQSAVDPLFNVTKIDSSDLSKDNLTRYNSLILSNVSLNLLQIELIYNFTRDGGSILYFANSNNDTEYNFLLNMQLVVNPANVTFSNNPDDTAVFDIVDDNDPLVSGIQWSSAPDSKVYQVVKGYNETVVTALRKYGNNIPIIYRCEIGNGRFIGINTIYSKSFNWDFQLWPYTPYFIYRSLSWLNTVFYDTYGEWSYSPIPHETEKNWLILYQIGIFCLGYGAFIFAKRRSKRPLDETLIIKLAEIKKEDVKQVTEQIQKGEIKEDIEKNKWERVGLHRQIQSFFLQLFTALIVSIPMLLVTGFIYPRFVQPFPMVQGWLNWTGSFFSTLFLVFDLGTTAAMTKFFAEYRIHEPAKAIKYAQIFIWWQILTGCIQITIVSTMGAYVLSSGMLGHMTWFFILSSLSQFPGMLGIIGMVLEAMQRFDKKILYETLFGSVLASAINYTIILICRAIFATQVAYGEAVGAGIGIVIGGYVSSIISFLLFSMVFKRMGFSLGTLFRVDFNKSNLKETLTYGSKLTAGNVWVALIGLLEITLIATYVVNYNAEMGNLAMMSTITGLVWVACNFYTAMFPAMSEAYNNKKMKLFEYYLVEGFKWGNFMAFFVLAVLAAAADKILIGFAGMQWYGAAKYLLWLVGFNIFQPWSLYVDKIFQATGKTGYNTLVWIIEQSTRSLLLLIFLPIFQMNGLYMAYIPGIAAKCFISFAITRRKIIKFKWYWMHTFIVPGISAAIIYGGVKLLTLLIWDGGVVTSAIIFVVGLFGGLYTYAFLTGLLGGWDDNTIDEFKRGLGMIKTIQVMFKLLENMVVWGHNLCPWKNKFKIDLYIPAEEEAIILTQEKQKLII